MSRGRLKRHVVSKQDSRALIADIEKGTGLHLDLPKSAQVEVVEPDEETKFVTVDGRFVFLEKDGSFLPFVGSPALTDLLPSVRIDDGAVKYIVKGADVMRPGIVKYDEWGEAGKLVVVRDDSKGRALAIGRTLVGSGEMAGLQKGNCVKNLHHAGDRFWHSHKAI
jgi:malignant T-cell-amplified sequence